MLTRILCCCCRRDADRVAGLLEANGIYNTKLLVNRVRPDMIQKNNMMSVRDVQVRQLSRAKYQCVDCGLRGKGGQHCDGAGAPQSGLRAGLWDLHRPGDAVLGCCAMLS